MSYAKSGGASPIGCASNFIASIRSCSAPSRYAVFYPFRRGRHRDRRRDGAPARPGDILIAEDLTGQGHATREVGPEPRVSIFVPLQASKS